MIERAHTHERTLRDGVIVKQLNLQLPTTTTITIGDRKTISQSNRAAPASRAAHTQRPFSRCARTQPQCRACTDQGAPLASLYLQAVHDPARSVRASRLNGANARACGPSAHKQTLPDTGTHIQTDAIMSLTVELFDLPAHQFRVFWGASGSMWQSLWDRFLDFTGTCVYVWA